MPSLLSLLALATLSALASAQSWSSSATTTASISATQTATATATATPTPVSSPTGTASATYTPLPCPLRLFPKHDVIGTVLSESFQPSEAACMLNCCNVADLCVGYSFQASMLGVSTTPESLPVAVSADGLVRQDGEFFGGDGYTLTSAANGLFPSGIHNCSYPSTSYYSCASETPLPPSTPSTPAATPPAGRRLQLNQTQSNARTPSQTPTSSQCSACSQPSAPLNFIGSTRVPMTGSTVLYSCPPASSILSYCRSTNPSDFVGGEPVFANTKYKNTQEASYPYLL